VEKNLKLQDVVDEIVEIEVGNKKIKENKQNALNPE